MSKYTYISCPEYSTFAANLRRAGAILGGVKGLTDKPDSITDPTTGLQIQTEYSPLQRLSNVGVNAAIGAGLGELGNRAGLNTVEGVNRAGRLLGDKWRNYSANLPQVTVTYQ